MWYAKGLWPIACLLIASGSVAAQTIFHNDGNVVHVGSNAIVYVEGGVNNLNDGQLANGGTFHFSDDWSSNTAVSDDVSSLAGTFVYEGAQLDIYGSSNVVFPTFQLTPGVTLVRQIETNVSISQRLDLEFAEWATGSNTLSIITPEPSAIDREDGFVSSDTIGGYLVRVMDRQENYLFPTGSTGTVHRDPIPRYRPVIILPLGGSVADEYAVRFGNTEATTDFTDGGTGFDLNNRQPSITNINEEFYHMVDHPVGTSAADLEFYYDQNDGRFSTVAQVQDNGEWTDMFGSVDENVLVPFGTEGLDRVASLAAHTDFTQPVFTEAGADQDNDGVADRLDLDADNDGIANIEESPRDAFGNRVDPYGDHDGDGYFDYLDADHPACGTIVNSICSNFDADLDGFANHLDLDADGDGIADIIEAGGIDLDLDAQVEYTIPGVASSMIDIDLDGFADANDYLDGNRAPTPGDEVTSGTPWPREDRDNDGLANDQDIDSDGDGIVDFIEGQTTTGYLFPNYFDANNNGIDNAFDFLESGYAITPTNTDGVDQPDYLDLNSDNERTSDLAEGYDLNGDGLLDAGLEPTGVDSDGDGLDDAYDLLALSVTPARNASNNQAFAEQFPNFQDVGTIERDWREVDCKQQDCQPLLTIRNQP